MIASLLQDAPSEEVTLLGQQVNLLWIVVGAVLVIFMQAGFALVETGFTRAKHSAHVVSTNFAIFGLGFVAFFPRGLRLHVRRLQLRVAGLRLRLQRTGRRCTHRLGRVGVPVAGRVCLVRRRCRRRCGGDRVLPLHGCLHGHDGHDPHRGDGRAVAVEELRALGLLLRRHLLPAVRCLDLGRGLAEPTGQQLGARFRLRRLRRVGRGARHGWRRGAGGGLRSRSAHRQVRQGRQAEGPSRPPHPHGHAGHVHPAVRLVRLQRSVDARGHRCAVRHRRHQHGDRRGVRCDDLHALRDVDDGEARPVDDGQRHACRLGRDHRTLRLRRPMGGDGHRHRGRCARGGRHQLHREEDEDRRPGGRDRGPRRQRHVGRPGGRHLRQRQVRRRLEPHHGRRGRAAAWA